MLTVHKAKDETMIGLTNTYAVGQLAPCGTDGKANKQGTFERDNVLFITAFDNVGRFEGWAEVNPAPKTTSDLEAEGFDVFKAALDSSIIKTQARIRAKGNGKRAVDEALANLVRQFALGQIDLDTMKAKAAALTSGGVVQL